MAPQQQQRQRQQQDTTMISSSSNSREEELRFPLLGDGDIREADNNNDENDSSKNITIPLPSCPCSCCFKDNDDDDDDEEEEEEEQQQQQQQQQQRKEIKVNHNVLLNLIVAIFYGISESLWNGTAYAAYLKKIGRDRNGPLGDIEAVSGLTTLLTALPVGYLADKIGRSKVITAGGVLLGITTIVQIGVLQWVGTDESAAQTNKTALWMMGVLMAFWGIGDGIVNGPASALYADSTPEGDRSKYYNYLFAAYTTSTMVGPLASIWLFQTLGDTWDLYDLRCVIYVGLGLQILISILMCFFDDSKALDENSESDDECEEHNNNDSEDREIEALLVNDDEHNLVREAAEEEEENNEVTPPPTPLQERQKWIPYIVFAQGLIFSLGSGMTIKFFPLFFKDEVGMSPSQVQIIYCLVPLVMVICATIASNLAATGFGRVQTTLLFAVMGVSCLYCMVFFKHYLDAHPFLLVPIYVLRTSLMNSTYPLQESILMDFVPKDVRARWKSLDSVAAFGWCGSAALGGWLSDKFDYTYTFLITAILQTIGIAVWSLLLPLVPRKEGSRHDDDDIDGRSSSSSSSSEEIEE